MDSQTKRIRRESDGDSQGLLILCESPCHRRFIRVGAVHEYSSPVTRIRNSHGFASQADLRESDTHAHMPISESINTDTTSKDIK